MKNKNKKMSIFAVFIKMLYLIMIILLFYIVGVLVQMERDSDYKKSSSPEIKTEEVNLDGKTKFASYFPECDLLNSECLSTDCDQYFLCSGKEYSRCEVYDCGEEYGIGAENKDGKVDISRRAKDNKKKIAEVKSRCNGTIEIIEGDCLDEKLEIAVRVATNGVCKVEGFLIGYGNGEEGEEARFKPAKFSNPSSGLYLISVNSCNIMEVIAIGENGVSIK